MLWFALGIIGVALVLLIFNHDAGQIAGIDADSFARLAMGSILVLVIGSGMLFSYRGRMRQAGRDMILWIAIIAALLTAYAFRTELAYVSARVQAELIPGSAIVQQAADGSQVVELRQRDDGHFAAVMQVNGAEVTMLVDTGASLVTLTPEDAMRAGIDVNSLTYSAIVNTANGRAAAAPVTIDKIGIGGIVFDNVRGFVSEQNGLNESLLGISFLSRLESYEIRGGALVMRDRL